MANDLNGHDGSGGVPRSRAPHVPSVLRYGRIGLCVSSAEALVVLRSAVVTSM